MCLVRGVGDIGSAVAHLLFREGYAVGLHDEPTPTTTRRAMAFADGVSSFKPWLDSTTAVAKSGESIAVEDMKRGDSVEIRYRTGEEKPRASKWAQDCEAGS